MGLMEIVTLERSLTLNVQGKCSEVDYLRAFQANTDAINLAGGYVGGIIAAAKLVAKEQELNYKMAEPLKQANIMEEAAERYLVALAFTGLNSEGHTQLKADVKHDWVRNKTGSLPHTYERLMEVPGGYETRDRPRTAQGPTRSRGGADQYRRPRSGGARLWRTRQRCRTRRPRWTRQTRQK